MSSATPTTGPILILDDIRDGQLHLAALFIASKSDTPSHVETPFETIAPQLLAEYAAHDVYRVRFTLPADRQSSYRWNDTEYNVAGLTADLRIAYASCNGEEHGDMDRDGTERNAMWARMGDEHRRAPFSLLLHGGDQVYADEVTQGHPLSDGWPDHLPSDPARADLVDLRSHLREGFLERYLANYTAPEVAYVMARVPSLMQWDDHDICDGWGSLRRSRTYSPVGQVLFDMAREAALLFQHGTVEGDLPARFADPSGLHLGWSVAAPGLRLIGPDLRSERTRREVLGKRGWQWMEGLAAAPAPGRTLVMSSVPLLGPRLSLLELLMVLTPRMQKYEDDLRDQWQSRAHRDSWAHMLELMQRIAAPADQDVTVVSGEIHLATRGEMKLDHGKLLHQLVASGVAHRAPPKAWARVLGALATVGETPLPGHPIHIRRIPGQKLRYVAERNYLILTHAKAGWSAQWDFEVSGISAPLPL
ncbi:alkaline phosphatase D family protein [Ruegeria sp.]|uniref:alkaline phosphatase D family protein n=1 Tax=Ruegeria sp. TaxID=1879320 RepID=UPI003B590879